MNSLSIGQMMDIGVMFAIVILANHVLVLRNKLFKYLCLSLEKFADFRFY